MDNYNNPEVGEMMEFEGERLMGVGSRETKKSYFEDLENLKRTYQQINEFRTRKSDGSDLENQAGQIIAFFCQCAQLENSVIASKRIEESFMLNFFNTWHINLCRHIFNTADNFKPILHDKYHLDENKWEKEKVELFVQTVYNFISRDRINWLYICTEGIEDDNCEFLERQHMVSETDLDDSIDRITIDNDFGGAIIIKIVISGTFYSFSRNTSHLSTNTQDHIYVTEVSWDKENPFRQYHYRIMLVEERPNLLGVIDRCANIWVNFLKEHSLLPENYSMKS